MQHRAGTLSNLSTKRRINRRRWRAVFVATRRRRTRGASRRDRRHRRRFCGRQRGRQCCGQRGRFRGRQCCRTRCWQCRWHGRRFCRWHRGRFCRRHCGWARCRLGHRRRRWLAGRRRWWWRGWSFCRRTGRDQHRYTTNGRHGENRWQQAGRLSTRNPHGWGSFKGWFSWLTAASDTPEGPQPRRILRNETLRQDEGRLTIFTPAPMDMVCSANLPNAARAYRTPERCL